MLPPLLEAIEQVKALGLVGETVAGVLQRANLLRGRIEALWEMKVRKYSNQSNE